MTIGVDSRVIRLVRILSGDYAWYPVDGRGNYSSDDAAAITRMGVFPDEFCKRGVMMSGYVREATLINLVEVAVENGVGVYFDPVTRI